MIGATDVLLTKNLYMYLPTFHNTLFLFHYLLLCALAPTFAIITMNVLVCKYTNLKKDEEFYKKVHCFPDQYAYLLTCTTNFQLSVNLCQLA